MSDSGAHTMGQRHWPSGMGAASRTRHGPQVAKMRRKVKKSAKKFGGFTGNAYLCGMKQTRTTKREPRDAWVVTGKNRLTGVRDQLTGVVPRETAASRMERYLQAARRQKYPTYTNVRIERAVAQQLTLQFTND